MRGSYPMYRNEVPLEDTEEAIFATWLDRKKIWHTHLSNETYTTSWSQKRKMRMLGVHSGTPDHLCLVPSQNGKTYAVFVEMKRTKFGTISDEQFDAISRIMECEGVMAFVAYGANQAISLIESVQRADWQSLEAEHNKFIEKKNRREAARKNPKKRTKSIKKIQNIENTENDCPY